MLLVTEVAETLAILKGLQLLGRRKLKMILLARLLLGWILLRNEL